jgi:hypothetical protein
MWHLACFKIAVVEIKGTPFSSLYNALKHSILCSLESQSKNRGTKFIGFLILGQYTCDTWRVSKLPLEKSKVQLFHSFRML